MRALVLHRRACAITFAIAACSDAPNNTVPLDPGDAPGVDALQAPPCGDGIVEEPETDVDCGGACSACAAGKHCKVASDCVTGNCSATTNTCSLQTVSFADAVSYAASFKPYVMLAGDLDGDGDLDLAVANEEGNTISVFRNVGVSSGMYVPVPASTRDGFPTGEYPTGGAVADLNGDGIPDVVTANYHGNSVSVMLGAGSGDAYALMSPATYVTAVGAETSNLAIGDLNGDAIPDVIATNPQTSSISVFLGRADGTLQPAHNSVCGTTGYTQPYSVAIGDFDGNGINDAAIADNTTSTIFIALGNGDGTFHLEPAQLAVGGVPPLIIITRDMNLDGNLDLIVADRNSDDISVLLGRGDGGFRDAIVSSTGPNTGPYSLAVADFNLDGVPDVVTANYLSSTTSVLLGNGDGTFEAPIDAGKTGQTAYGVVAGDFNGDGKPDFATANAISNDMTVKLSTSQ